MQPNAFPRRTILAAAVATMAGGCAPAPASASPAPDADLIRLGQEFARAFDAWWQAHGSWRTAHEEACAALAPNGTLGADETWLEAFNRAYDASPADAASAANEAALDRCDALAEAIRAIRPTTLAGLAAHAKVARFHGVTLADLSMPRADLDHAPATILDFLDLVEGLAS